MHINITQIDLDEIYMWNLIRFLIKFNCIPDFIMYTNTSHEGSVYCLVYSLYKKLFPRSLLPECRGFLLCYWVTAE